MSLQLSGDGKVPVVTGTGQLVCAQQLNESGATPTWEQCAVEEHKPESGCVSPCQCHGLEAQWQLLESLRASMGRFLFVNRMKFHLHVKCQVTQWKGPLSMMLVEDLSHCHLMESSLQWQGEHPAGGHKSADGRG